MLDKYYNAYWNKRLSENILPPIRDFIPKFLKKYTSYGAILNQISKDSNILDIGCGDGNVSSLYKKKGRVHGIDISSKAVDSANSKGIRAKVFDLNSNEKLPYSGEYFDIVVLTDVLEHVINPVFLLNDIRRVLKPRGKVIITVPNFARLSNRMKMFLGDPVDQLHWSKYGDEIEHLHWFTKPKIKHLLKENNYYSLKFVTTGLPFGFLFGLFKFYSLSNMLTITAKK